MVSDLKLKEKKLSLKKENRSDSFCGERVRERFEREISPSTLVCSFPPKKDVSWKISFPSPIPLVEP